MTRAKDDLMLVQPLKFPLTHQPKQGDAHVYGGRSRFMTEKVLKTLEATTFQGSNLGEASLAEAGQSALDAVERVKSMW
jgi:DNA helicase-2/ATP-dependent DNA helicase PcrA